MMAGEGDPLTDGDIQRWCAELRRWSAEEFTARHQGLFLLVGQPSSASERVDFETCDAHNYLAKLTRASRSDHDELRVLRIEKSSRNPYTDRISLGRARNCDVVIRHPSVSKLHAHIRVEAGERYTIADVGSHNGTRVDDRPLVPHKPEPFMTGSVISFGTVVTQVLNGERLRRELLRLVGPLSVLSGR
ncbi:FHA domain-containing protein [Sorangium cellulosum]|nr:FHA domain-containing protein [Sorangium cellulosum]